MRTIVEWDISSIDVYVRSFRLIKYDQQSANQSPLVTS